MKLHFFNMDARRTGFLSTFSGRTLSVTGADLPEGLGKSKIAWLDQVLEMPEVVQGLGQEGDLPLRPFEALL